MGARVVLDGGAALEPPHRAHERVKREHDAEASTSSSAKPCASRQTGSCATQVGVLLERVGYPRGDALPRERDLLPALRAAGADQEPEHRAGRRPHRGACPE